MPNKISVSEFRTRYKDLPKTSKILAVIAAALVVIILIGLLYSFVVQPLLPQSGQISAAQGHYRTALVKRGDFDNSIQTSGSVRSNQTATLVWQTNGTVDIVNVEKGDAVKADDVLAKLDSTTMPQGVILAEVQLVNAQRALDTLLSSSQARANAELALVKAQQAVDDAIKHRRSLEYRRASDETIDIAHANLIQANDELDKATERFNKNRDRSETSLTYAAALAAYAKARQLQIQAQYNYDYVSQLPDPLDIQEADSKVEVAQANLLQAKTDWERVKDGPNKDDVAAAKAQVDAAQATFISAYRNLKGYRGGSFKAWLLRIATNACYDELRRRQRRPTIPLEPVTPDDEEIESPAWIADPGDSPEEIAERQREAALDLAATQKAAAILRKGGPNAYTKARRALLQESREWWDEHVEEEEHPATAEGLAEFIRDSLEPICYRMAREAEFTPAIKAQTLGEGLRAHLLEKLNRYETHLDRKFERTLAMLLKLKDLRGA